jgi:predicted DNA-binding transcriptional regulator AlpA
MVDNKTHPHLPRAGALPLDGYTRWNELKHYVPFSRETLRQHELAGRFPQRIHFSSRCAAWSNRELHRYFENPECYCRQDSK